MGIGAPVERWKRSLASPGAKRVLRVLRALFAIGVLGVLAYQITEIGWLRLVTSLPESVLFYGILLAMYFLLPVTEALIYGRLWLVRPRDCIGVMLRKRVLNVDVLGYSGEVYLLFWARARTRLAEQRLRGVIKDNLLASAAGSLGSAVLVLVVLMLVGSVSVADFYIDPQPYYFAVGGVAAALIAVIVVRFRTVVFYLPSRSVAALGGAHLGRFLLSYALTILQWSVVIPSVSLRTWTVLLVLMVLVNRIPFIPSSDLVLAGLGSELAAVLGVPVAPFLGMLLVRSAIDRLLNMLTYSVTSFLDRNIVSRHADAAEPTAGIGALASHSRHAEEELVR